MADFMTGLENIGQFLQSPQMPVLTGQMGTAMMDPYARTDPKAAMIANLGRVGTGFGQSAIAANEAKAQAAKGAETQAWLKQLLPHLLAGNSMTPPEQLGASGQTIKVNHDGTAKITTDVTTQTPGGNAPAGAPVGTNSVLPIGTAPQAPGQPVVAPTQAPQGLPATRPVGINPRVLPFF